MSSLKVFGEQIDVAMEESGLSGCVLIFHALTRSKEQSHFFTLQPHPKAIAHHTQIQ